MDDIINGLNNVNISNTNILDNNVRKKNKLYEKFISIEVANFYCKEYFDDEDFIYMTFELPYDLLDEIIHSCNSSIIEYFNSFMNTNIKIEDNNEYEDLYYNIYNNCIAVYDKILEHLMPSWYCDDSPHDPDDYSKFNIEWTSRCKIFLESINYVLIHEINDSSIEYLSIYNKEVYIGMEIIVSKLEEIFTYFNNKTQLNDFYDNDKDYRHISVRLLNNLCVILLYLRFYYLNEKGEPSIESTPSIDCMITTEE